MQPPVENYLVSSSAEARSLAGSKQGTIPTSVQSEKEHVFELGALYRINRYLDFDITGYTKLIDDFIVRVELGNSGVIFPVNLKKGVVAGGELRARLRDWSNISGFVSFSTVFRAAWCPVTAHLPLPRVLCWEKRERITRTHSREKTVSQPNTISF